MRDVLSKRDVKEELRQTGGLNMKCSVNGEGRVGRNGWRELDERKKGTSDPEYGADVGKSKSTTYNEKD